MKSRKNFTMIELLAVIAIIGILATALVTGVNSALAKGRAAACGGNLRAVGQEMLNYRTDNRFFPCGVKDTDSSAAIERRRKDTKRSTERTLSYFHEYDAESLDPGRYFCPNTDKIEPRRKEDKLRKENIGYHYVNGDVSQRVIKDNMALMRDLNFGHEDAEYGKVLLGSGAVESISKLGKESSSKPGNYRTNWYRNDDQFINCKDFDSYNKKVNTRSPDDID